MSPPIFCVAHPWGDAGGVMEWQASPGVETHRHRHVSFLTGTFTESSEPFEDVDGFVCAFAGAMEYDVVQTGTFCGPWAGLTMSEQGEHWSVDQQTPIFVS